MQAKNKRFQPLVEKGSVLGTIKIVAECNPDNHLAVKIGSQLDGSTERMVSDDFIVINPYVSGANISGVDFINKYISIYEANQENQIINKEMIMLSDQEIVPAKWDLVWEELFTSNTIDQKKWNFVEGGWGFGNQELQYYTDREENARIEDGMLILEARKENYKGMDYTSAKITTKGKVSWKYGRFSIRAKLPEGQGIWPAIWMMPEDMECYSGWPACGEIDIMELIGHQPGTVYGTLHYGFPHTYTGENFTLPNNKKFSEEFHVFTLDWEPDEFRWYVDGVLYARQNRWFSNRDGAEIPYPKYAPFDREFYLQLNVAVGGKWPGNPNDSTYFPQKMVIDCIRVFQKAREGGRNE